MIKAVDSKRQKKSKEKISSVRHRRRVFPANTLILLQRLHSLALGFGTFGSQKTEFPHLTTVCYRNGLIARLVSSNKPGTDAL